MLGCQDVLHEALIETGFTRLAADLACCDHEETIIFVIAHVDDTLSVGETTKDHLKKEKVKTKDLGEGSLLIGLNLVRFRGKGLIILWIKLIIMRKR